MSKVTTLVLISVGNSRSRIAVARGPAGEFAAASIEPSVVVENTQAGALEDAIREAVGEIDPDRSRALVASVNEPMLPRISAALDQKHLELVRLGNGRGGTVRVPVAMNVENAEKVGVDRLLCALASTSRSGGQPCAVIDAGTCVTVDFVDQHGVFQGGAITPGVSMMLRAMHEGTSALPLIQPPRTGQETAWMTSDEVRGALGKNTQQAMTLGALNAVRGLVRWQVERFAEVAGAYPRVIATGGDAALLFDPQMGGGDDLVEHIVPDLQLVGMAGAWASLHGGVEEVQDESEDDDQGEEE